jgi:hypothetical protein
MARGPGRPKGSRNKTGQFTSPAKSITEIGTEAYRQALETQPTPKPVVIDPPSQDATAGKSAPDAADKPAAPSFDPSKFEGGFSTAVGDPPPVPAPPDATEAKPPEPDIARRRGRPPGPRGNINASGMEQLLLGIHTTLYHATKAPEWELGKEEAHAVAEAYAEAAKHYPMLNIDPKHAAVINLGTTLSIVYGSRVMAFRMRKAMERGARPQRVNTAPVTPAQPAPAMRAETLNGIPVPPETKPPPVPTEELRTGEVPGLGNIVFPADHPLVSGRKQ